MKVDEKEISRILRNYWIIIYCCLLFEIYRISTSKCKLL